MFAWMEDELNALESQDLRRWRRVRESCQTARVRIAGREVVNLASNDYLGIAADEQVVQEVQQTLAECGLGAGASPLVSGYSCWHAQLEQELAEFTGSEAALVFSSGYAANVGTIAALVGSGDAVFGDKLNHASLIDGCRLSGAYFRTFRHRDLDHLESHLQKAPSARRKLIVTDSVFSMDGDVAPLSELATLAERYGAMFFVDEAHATGLFGSHGSGLCEASGIDPAGLIHLGTLSKGLGSAGGFVAGPRTLIDFLVNRARSYIYSTAPSQLNVLTALAALRVVREQPQRRKRLRELAEWFRSAVQQQRWQTGASQTQIVPLIVGNEKAALELSQALWQSGYWVPAIRPPTVPPGTARLRISLTSQHNQSELANFLEILGSISAKLSS